MPTNPPDDDEPVTPYAGTSGWSGSEASRDRAERRDHDGSTAALQTRLVVLVARTGSDGLTVDDARRVLPEHHGSVSGALSVLHMVGRVRAAGSLGVADIVALREGAAPLLIACKTNGRLPPDERRSLVDAAHRAGARPTMATRTRRGYVDLLHVDVDGCRPYAVLKTPPRTKADPDE
jgi:hypothetical protein